MPSSLCNAFVHKFLDVTTMPSLYAPFMHKPAQVIQGRETAAHACQCFAGRHASRDSESTSAAGVWLDGTKAFCAAATGQLQSAGSEAAWQASIHALMRIILANMTRSLDLS